MVTIGKATVTSTSVPNNIFAIPFTMHRKKASDALWFAATYGLMPDSLVFSDDSGQLHTIEVNGSSSEGKPIFYWLALRFHLKISNVTNHYFLLSSATGPENTVETIDEVNEDKTEISTSKGKF